MPFETAGPANRDLPLHLRPDSLAFSGLRGIVLRPLGPVADPGLKQGCRRAHPLHIPVMIHAHH
jgi:hypothetical protein